MMERIERRSYLSSASAQFGATLKEQAFGPHATDLPVAFRRLVGLVEDSPPRLEPGRIVVLLKEAGLEREFEDIARHAQDLGLKVEAVLSITLSGLLGGPLGKNLSSDTQSACIALQEFARHAVKAIKEIGDGSSVLVHAIRDAAGLELVTNKTFEVVARLEKYGEMLHHIKHFLHQKADEFEAPTENMDLSEIGDHIDWDLAPDHLRLGDLSGLDQAIARAIHDAAAHSEIIAFARQLGIDPVSLVIGLIAQAKAPQNRTAARIAKAILCNTKAEELTAVIQKLRLN